MCNEIGDKLVGVHSMRSPKETKGQGTEKGVKNARLCDQKRFVYRVSPGVEGLFREGGLDDG